MKVGLISCVKSKLNTKSKAKDLYTSTLFTKAYAYAERNYDQIFILSALHGLLDDEKEIEPYDLTLNTMKQKERLSWARKVRESVNKKISKDAEIFIHAGWKYREFLAHNLVFDGYIVNVPLEGLGIGKQLQWYSRQDLDKIQLKLM